MKKRNPERNDKTKVYMMTTSTIYSSWIQTVVDGNSSQSSVTKCRLINLKEIWMISKMNSFFIFFSPLRRKGAIQHNCIDDQNSNSSFDQSFVGIGKHLEQSSCPYLQLALLVFISGRRSNLTRCQIHEMREASHIFKKWARNVKWPAQFLLWNEFLESYTH